MFSLFFSSNNTCWFTAHTEPQTQSCLKEGGGLVLREYHWPSRGTRHSAPLLEAVTTRLQASWVGSTAVLSQPPGNQSEPRVLQAPAKQNVRNTFKKMWCLLFASVEITVIGKSRTWLDPLHLHTGEVSCPLWVTPEGAGLVRRLSQALSSQGNRNISLLHGFIISELNKR